MEGLLDKDPNERLGNGKLGLQNIKDHPWFESIDWENLLEKKIKPPFIPKLSSETDTKYIDEEFTKLAADDSAREASLLEGSKKGLWEGFTYEDSKICQ